MPPPHQVLDGTDGVGHDHGSHEHDDGEPRKDATTAGPVILDVDAHSKTDWVYFAFANDGVVVVDDAANSTDWDIGFRRTQIRTNSGTSGPGQGGAVDLDVTDFPASDKIPTEFVVDELLPLPGPPGTTGEFSGNPILNGWYTFIPPGGVSTNNVVYGISTSDGMYGMLQIESYVEGQISLRWMYDASTDI